MLVILNCVHTQTNFYVFLCDEKKKALYCQSMMENLEEAAKKENVHKIQRMV